jgi:hypothetical protein
MLPKKTLISRLSEMENTELLWRKHIKDDAAGTRSQLNLASLCVSVVIYDLIVIRALHFSLDVYVTDYGSSIVSYLNTDPVKFFASSISSSQLRFFQLDLLSPCWDILINRVIDAVRGIYI